MSKIKYRKVTPQPPRYAWLDLDGCYFCNNRNNCGNCKVMKGYVIKQKEKLKKRDKREYEKYR